MARYSPVKFCQGTLSTASDLVLFNSAPSGAGSILKQIILTNTSSSAITAGVSVAGVSPSTNGINMFDQFDALSALQTSYGSWQAYNGYTTITYPVNSLMRLTCGTASVPVQIYSGYFALASSTTYTLTLTSYGTTGRPLSATVTYSLNNGSVSSGNSVITTTDTTSSAVYSGTFTTPANVWGCFFSIAFSSLAVGEVHYVGNLGLSSSSAYSTYAVASLRSISRVFPDMSLQPGVTTLDLSAFMNPGDYISGKASASGVNYYISGVNLS